MQSGRNKAYELQEVQFSKFFQLHFKLWNEFLQYFLFRARDSLLDLCKLYFVRLNMDGFVVGFTCRSRRIRWRNVEQRAAETVTFFCWLSLCLLGCFCHCELCCNWTESIPLFIGEMFTSLACCKKRVNIKTGRMFRFLWYENCNRKDIWHTSLIDISCYHHRFIDSVKYRMQFMNHASRYCV